MVEIATPYPHLSKWAMELDTQGWDNLLKGCIGNEILHFQTASIKKQGSQCHIKSWVTKFIWHLLGITHKQWHY